MADFGNKFKVARESNGLELEKVAQETRISARFLRAIEGEAFEELPGGLFNRGFIRTYARRVGLDPDEAVAEYQELVSEPSLEESEISQKPPLESREKHVLPIALGSLIVVIVLFYVFATDTRSQTESAFTDTTESTALNEFNFEPTPPVARTAPARINPVADSVPVSESSETELILDSADEEELAPETPAATPDTTEDEIDGVSVTIDVHYDTWVAVQSDGQEVVEGIILAAGTTERYSAAEALRMTIGNAAGLTLSINGREVPSLGRDGQVRTLTITPSNASRFTGS